MKGNFSADQVEARPWMSAASKEFGKEKRSESRLNERI